MIRRPGFVTFLAVLHFLGTAVWALLLAVCLYALGTADRDIRNWVAAAAGVCAMLAGLQFACGLGLVTLKSYGRILQIVLAVPFLISFPFGTAISILLLIYLNKPGIRLLFSGRPVADMAPEERTAVTADGGLPGVAVAVIVLISISSFFVLPMVAAIAVPGFLRARMTANENAAMALLQVTTSSQVAYAASCGNGGYATSYLVIGEPMMPATEPFISPGFGPDAPQKNGYNFFLRAGAAATAGPADCQGRPTVSSWYATAIPQTFGSTGTRAFAANDRDGVWGNTSGTPPAEPFGPPASRVR